jgi:Flp pilus assembly protein TadD
MAASENRQLARALRAAEGYLALEMPDHALLQLHSVRDIDAAAFEWHLLSAEALRLKSDWVAALADFQHCHALRPQDIHVLMGLAWCYKRTGRLPQAIETMHAAHRIDEREPILLYNLACYYALAKNKQQALSWLGRALRMQRDLLQLIPAETDFDSLRHDPDFRKLLDLARGTEASPREP